ncbi:MAG: hypothetical protein WCF57_17570 [Pyrinomonadaceae bacterium]
MKEMLKDIHLWVQVIAPTVTLPLILWQLVNLRRSIYSSTYQRIYEQMIKIDEFFFNNKEFKPFFYPGSTGKMKEIDDEGVDDNKKISRDQLNSAAEMMVDFFDSVYHQKRAMPKQTFDGFGEFMRKVYMHSTVMQEFIEKRQDWYPSHFLDLLRTGKGLSRK